MNDSDLSAACCCSNSFEKHDASKPVSGVKSTARSASSIILSILIAFFPKCPLCWAAYMSLLGCLGLAKIPYQGWLFPVLLVFLAVHLFLIYRRSARSGYRSLLLSLTGAGILLSARVYFPDHHWLLFLGIVLFISGSLLNSFSSWPLKPDSMTKQKSNQHGDNQPAGAALHSGAAA